MTWTVSGNIRGPQGIQGIQGPQGTPGTNGTSVEIAGQVATYSALPSNLTPADAGDGYLVEADGLLYVWGGSSFPANGNGVEFRGPIGFTGATGATGAAATITIGTVSTLPDTSPATVSNTGSPSEAVFNFGIPRGVAGMQGESGAAATIAVGTIATLSPGSSATVTNAGSSSAALLNFGIPQGATGATGNTGNTGVTGTRGSKWYTGTGAPGTVSGSMAGDQYLDTASGDVYTLS